MYSNQRGYTLVEVVISVAVSILVIGALTFATISSLRNAQLAKRQSQATKYAQEGLEKLRSIRNRDEVIVTNFPGGIDIFSELWTIPMYNASYCNGICYFRLVNGATLTQAPNDTYYEDLEGGVFRRQIQITDKDICVTGTTQITQCHTQEKQITSIVKWTDFAGDHESNLTTILRKL